jgi:hypothetical protein
LECALPYENSASAFDDVVSFAIEGMLLFMAVLHQRNRAPCMFEYHRRLYALLVVGATGPAEPTRAGQSAEL